MMKRRHRCYNQVDGDRAIRSDRSRLSKAAGRASICPATCRKGSKEMAVRTSRRRFVGRTAQTLGVLAFDGPQAGQVSNRVRSSQDCQRAPTSAATLIERGVAFLRPRQDAKGGWSTQREPGVTALVVTALLRSGQVAPGDPAVTKALGLSREIHRAKGWIVGGTARELLDVDRARRVPASQRQRPVRPHHQGRTEIPDDHAVG